MAHPLQDYTLPAISRHAILSKPSFHFQYLTQCFFAKDITGHLSPFTTTVLREKILQQQGTCRITLFPFQEESSTLRTPYAHQGDFHA